MLVRFKQSLFLPYIYVNQSFNSMLVRFKQRQHNSPLFYHYSFNSMLVRFKHGKYNKCTECDYCFNSMLVRFKLEDHEVEKGSYSVSILCQCDSNEKLVQLNHAFSDLFQFYVSAIQTPILGVKKYRKINAFRVYFSYFY